MVEETSFFLDKNASFVFATLSLSFLSLSLSALSLFQKLANRLFLWGRFSQHSCQHILEAPVLQEAQSSSLHLCSRPRKGGR